MNDYPDFFLKLVDDWVTYERENQEAKLVEDSRYGVTFRSRSRLQREIHPQMKFERMIIKALSEARQAVQDLSIDDRKWYLYTEAGQRKAQREWEIRHAEVESDDESDGTSPESSQTDTADELYWRQACPPSPTPAQKPYTLTSTPTSPSKRASNTTDSIKDHKRLRCVVTPSPIPSPAPSRCTTSQMFGSASSRSSSVAKMSFSPLPTFPNFDFSQSYNATSPSSTPKPSMVVPFRSTTTNSMARPHTPTELRDFDDDLDEVIDINDIYENDDWQSIPSDLGESHDPMELVSPSISTDQMQELAVVTSLDDGAWEPVPARPDEEQTVLVLPISPYQHFFWQCDIKFHVQWELEMRMAKQCKVQWSDLHKSDLGVLKGNVVDALPKIDLVMQAGAKRVDFRTKDQPGYRLSIADLKRREKEISDILRKQPVASSDGLRRMSTEADAEEKSIRLQDGKNSYSDDPDRKYGGKLTYTIYVRPIEKSTKGSSVAGPQQTAAIELFRQTTIESPAVLPFSMELRPPSMTGKSFHLARQYGSRRILQFKFADISKPQARKDMFDLFHGRRFVLAGRVFRGWSAATDKSSLVAIEVDEAISGVTLPLGIERLDPKMPSFIDQLALSNDLMMKPGQAMAKWASRPQLLLSDSYPALRLEPSDVQVIDDIVVAGLSGPASTEQTLTDGCGLMTEAVARQIGVRLPSSHGRPCLVQMRLMGAKGLLVLMSPEQEAMYPGTQVILRKSMVKSLTKSGNTSRNILEVVRCGHNVLKTSATLRSEAIIALSSRKVPQKILLEKAEIVLEDLRTQFNPSPSGTETESEVRQRLAAAFYRTGGVGVERKKESCGKKALSLRVSGLIHDESDKPILNDCEHDDEDDQSGQPAQVAER